MDASVLGLLLVSSQPRYWMLEEFKRPIITVGRTGHIEIADDPTFARTQCLLYVQGRSVRLSHSYSAENPTTVNGVQPRGEELELKPGYLIRAGNTKLWTLGPCSIRPPLPILATSRYELFELALAWYGSVNAAAKALDIDRKTLHRRLEISATGRALLKSRPMLSKLAKEMQNSNAVPRSIERAGHEVPYELTPKDETYGDD